MLQLATPDAAQLGLSRDSLFNDKSTASVAAYVVQHMSIFRWSFLLRFLEQQGRTQQLAPRDARSRWNSFMSYDQAQRRV